MKNTVTIIRSEFGCDNCSASVKDLDHFPYEDGWRYLFALDARVGSKGVNFTVKDKQFCSFKCFLEFIVKSLTSTEEAKTANNMR